MSVVLAAGSVGRDIGPALRTLRRRPGVLALAVLEIAIGVTTINALLISGGWYQTLGDRPSGMDEPNLILLSTYTARPLGENSADDTGDDRGEDELHRRQAADRALVAAQPQIEAVSRISGTILEDRWSYPTTFVGRTGAGQAEPRDDIGWAYHADANLPATVGLRFLAGGAPAADAAARAGGGPSAAILTECLARRLFLEPARAVGGRLSGELARDVPVVGVVADVTMKVPFMPHSGCVAFLFGAVIDDHETRLLARARPGQRESALAALRAAFAPGNAAGAKLGHFVHVQPFDSMRGLHHRVGGGMVRLLSEIGVMMGVVALLAPLAATSFLVAERKRQIGIRRALGATRADIVRYFLVESGLATAMGAAIGLVFTAALYALMVRVFQDITFQTWRIALALGLLCLASVAATLLPALRAARVPPSVASRSL